MPGVKGDILQVRRGRAIAANEGCWRARDLGEGLMLASLFSAADACFVCSAARLLLCPLLAASASLCSLVLFSQKVVEFMSHHKGVEPPILEKPLRSKNMKELCKDPWDADFIDRIGEERQTLYDLILVRSQHTSTANNTAAGTHADEASEQALLIRVG